MTSNFTRQTSNFSEDTLVQQTTAEHLQRELGWESVYAWNDETFGPDGTLGRTSDREVVLARPLRDKLVELNPALPDEAYDDAVRIMIRDHLWSDYTGLPVNAYTKAGQYNF